MRRKPSKGKFRFLKYFLLLFFLILVVVILYFGSSKLRVQVLTIKINNADCLDEEMVRKSANLIGRNLFFIDLDNITQKIKNKYVCIKNIAATKNYPDKVNMTISGRQVKAMLISVTTESTSAAKLTNLLQQEASIASQIKNNKDQFVLVDDNGVVFSAKNEDSTILPVYVLDKNFIIGERLDASLIPNIEKINQLVPSIGMQNYDLFLDGSDLLVQDSTLKIVFNLKIDLNLQIASLQLILNKAKIDNENVQFIDLRFDKPVIKLIPKKS